jgi:hypothetical protein
VLGSSRATPPHCPSPHPDPNPSVRQVLDWVQRHLFAFRDEQRAKAEATKAQQEEAGGGAQVVQRFRMEYSPRVTGDSIRLFHDPSIPDFFARCVSATWGQNGSEVTSRGERLGES